MTIDESVLPASVLTKDQKKVFTKAIQYDGKPAIIEATVRYDDQCGNGHNSFAITGTISAGGPSGCIHEDIAKHFPEFAPYIKWHLTSSDGPMHYVANTVYLAGAKDYRGLLADGKSKLPVWELVVRNSKGELVKSNSNSWVDSAECPTESFTAKYEPVWIDGEGKARELDSARCAAVWLDATDEDLTAPGLEQRLIDRLPALMAEFKTTVESLGFTY